VRCPYPLRDAPRAALGQHSCIDQAPRSGGPCRLARVVARRAGRCPWASWTSPRHRARARVRTARALAGGHQPRRTTHRHRRPRSGQRRSLCAWRPSSGSRPTAARTPLGAKPRQPGSAPPPRDALRARTHRHRGPASSPALGRRHPVVPRGAAGLRRPLRLTAPPAATTRGDATHAETSTSGSARAERASAQGLMHVHVIDGTRWHTRCNYAHGR
jgi:hypothetical protein